MYLRHSEFDIRHSFDILNSTLAVCLSAAKAVMDSIPLRPHGDWRELYPFSSHFLEIAGGRYHFLDEFSGKLPAGTLLFVHGNPSWSFHWRSLIVALRSRYRCLAPDHLGCGLSSAPQQTIRLADRIDHLVEFIDRLDLEGVTLVAQDWGGAIGLGSLLARRDRFERIILFNTGAFRPWFIPWRIRVCRFPLLGRLAVQGGNLFCRAAVDMTVSRKPLSSSVIQGCLAPYNSWHRRRAVYDFVEDIPRSKRHPTWKTLGQIEDKLSSLSELPTQLVWGMKDWCFTPECLDKFAQLLPNADIHRLDDAGHWVVEDACQEVIEHVSAFLARSPR